MAVSLRDRGTSAKADTIETRARHAWHDVQGDWRMAGPPLGGSRRQTYSAESNRNFERVERFFYIGAGALVFVGSVIVVGSSLRGELPQTIDPANIATPQTIASPASSGAQAALTKLRSNERTSIIAGPVEPASTQVRPATAQDGAESAPVAQSPNSLSSSLTNLELEPDFLSDGIGGRRRAARRGAEDGASATATSAPQSETSGSPPQTGKCYVRISGRVLNSGACEISRESGGVTFQYSGQTLTLSPVKGKTWSATLGGKTLGNVYKSGSCWAAGSTYICDRGA